MVVSVVGDSNCLLLHYHSDVFHVKRGWRLVNTENHVIFFNQIAVKRGSEDVNDF